MRKKFAIKEIFYSIQGEGFYSGRPAIFVRFSSCNLWTGKEEHRANALCSFCDTDFIGCDGQNGGVYSIQSLIDKLKSISEACKFLVLTGGEPLLQVTSELVHELKENGYYVAVETNGTIEPPSNLDWICCSPKTLLKLKIEKANELKVVYPVKNLNPHDYSDRIEAEYYYIQPLDDQEYNDNVKQSIDFCKHFPAWNLSLQTQKIMNID